METSTEVKLACVEDEAKLSSFLQGFVSQHGYPFFMMHADGFGARRVMFEDASIARKFGQMWTSLGKAA